MQQNSDIDYKKLFDNSSNSDIFDDYLDFSYYYEKIKRSLDNIQIIDSPQNNVPNVNENTPLLNRNSDHKYESLNVNLQIDDITSNTSTTQITEFKDIRYYDNLKEKFHYSWMSFKASCVFIINGILPRIYETRGFDIISEITNSIQV